MSRDVRVEQTCFVDVVVWQRQAETCSQYLSKGSPVMLEGRLQLDSWKTKEGESRSKLRVRADRVQFLGSPRNAQYGDGGGMPPQQQAQPRPASGYDQGAPMAPPPAAPPAAPPVDPPPPDVMGGGQDEDNLPF